MNRCQILNGIIKEINSNSDPLQSAWQDMVETVSVNQGVSYTDTVTTAGNISVTSSGRAFNACVLHKTGSFYCVPWDTNVLASFNPNTSSFTSFGSLSWWTSNAFLKGVLAPNDCIYFLSRLYRSIVKYNLSTGECTEIGINVLTGYRGGVVYGNYIYAVSSSNKILKLDTRDDSYSFISTPWDYHNWVDLCWAPNGFLYSIPYRYTVCFKLNPKTDEYWNLGSVFGCNIGGGALATNGCIYCTPNDGTQILKINTQTDEFSYIGSFTSGEYKWYPPSLAPNGCLYATPQ